jgi:hypothetical protein
LGNSIERPVNAGTKFWVCASVKHFKRPLMMKRARGQSTVELVAGVIFIIPLVLFLIDASIITTCSFKNDSICREACRAAASVDPKDCESSAKAEVAKANTGGFAQYSLVSAKASNVETPASGHGLVSGNVTVRTACMVHAPFVIGMVVPTFKLESEQSFPITYNIPYKEEKEESK